MDPNNEEIVNTEFSADDESADIMSVDDFFRELEAKEKDLHITADTTIIELTDSFEDIRLTETPGKEKKAVQNAEAVKAAAKVESELKAKIAELESESGQLQARIRKMEEDRQEIFNNSQRRAKDFETYKARTERERTLTKQNQAGDLTSKMLPALDNLSRALDFAENEMAGRSPEFKQFFEGISMVNEQILSTFVEMGVHAIPAVGELFDPNKHEAVAVEETDDFAENVICEEMLRGFMIGGQVIRHSLVKVAKPTGNLINADPPQDSKEYQQESEIQEQAADIEQIENVSDANTEQGISELDGFELETFDSNDTMHDSDGHTDIESQISRFE